jgi:hypothetical protein
VVNQEVECKEYVKGWRGFQLFVRIESHKVTKVVRKPHESKPRPQGLVAAAALAEIQLDAPGDPPADTTETSNKDWMVACGVMPPNDTGGPAT